jgi:glucose/arabinose dehydrogenase
MQDGERLETPFIDLSGIVSQDVRSRYSERGLLGLAFHPNYAENGLFFVNYTDENGTPHVAEYTVSEDNPNRANPDSGRELLSVGQPYANHNGGHMSFGPDGYLYISFGDGGSADDPLNTGQDPGDLLGSLLRIDVTDYDAPQPYGIPEDNPVFDDPTFAPEVWSYGLRNVWRFSFDRATGDMYLADVGQNAIEEVNFEPVDADGGRNYGWEAYEGAQRYLGPEPQGNVVMPFTTYPHSQGCSVTGGYVYRGADIPELDAAYLYGDYCSGNIWAAYRNPDGNWQSDIIMNTNARISSFGEDESGELYVVDYNGRILRFEPAG